MSNPRSRNDETDDERNNDERNTDSRNVPNSSTRDDRRNAPSAQIRYDEGNTESRKDQLRRVNIIDEPRLSDLAKSSFGQLPKDVQGNLGSASYK